MNQAPSTIFAFVKAYNVMWQMLIEQWQNCGNYYTKQQHA